MKWKLAGVGLLVVVAGTFAALALAAAITPITVQPKEAAGTITVPPIGLGGDTAAGQPISVLSFSWGIDNKDGAGSAANLHELTITKLIDKTSPSFMLA